MIQKRNVNYLRVEAFTAVYTFSALLTLVSLEAIPEIYFQANKRKISRDNLTFILQYVSHFLLAGIDSSKAGGAISPI